jgi:SAM-dependent methyltransferase
LLDPSFIDYRYVGTDLAISALVANSKTLKGHFVQCSANALPFAKASTDVLLCLGTLHHLHAPEAALGRMIDTVKPGGLVGLHEVVQRRHLVARWRPPVESAHNAAIDPEQALQILGSECEIVDLKWEYSPVRGIVVSRLGEAMRTRPWLTSMVIRTDDVILNTLGRAIPWFGSRSMLALARKSGSGKSDRAP